MITLTNLEKVYRTKEIETVALENVNLTVDKGEFLSIMGPSGCGKSTLLNIMGLLDQPTRGTVEIAGVQTASMDDKQLAAFRNKTLGFVFQSFHLINSLNVLDNVELPLLYRPHVSAKERREAAISVLEKVGLSHRMRHFPTQLSGGQCQRVAIARAIIGNPEIILADEPTGNLDSKMGAEVMEILHKLYAFPLVPRLIFLHLWCTGLRISEVCTLKGDAYYWDGEDAWLKVYQIKMKADKMIPIPLVMYRIMRKYIEREHIRPKDYIFKGKDGGAYRGTTFRQEFQQYCDKNGIADGSYIFKTHDYRHTLATQFYDEDVSIQTIRDYLGHFSEEMTKQYVDFMPKRIEKASDTYFKKPENDLASTIKAKKRGERK